MCIWHCALKDKSMRIYEQATYETGLDQHKPFHFKQHTSIIFSHHFYVVVKTTIHGTSVLDAGTVQTAPKCMGEWEMFKTGCHSFHIQFPSSSHKLSPTPHEFQPLSSVWSETNLARQRPESPMLPLVSNWGWVLAIPPIMTQHVFQKRNEPQEKAALWPEKYLRQCQPARELCDLREKGHINK